MVLQSRGDRQKECAGAGPSGCHAAVCNLLRRVLSGCSGGERRLRREYAHRIKVGYEDARRDPLAAAQGNVMVIAMRPREVKFRRRSRTPTSGRCQMMGRACSMNEERRSLGRGDALAVGAVPFAKRNRRGGGWAAGGMCWRSRAKRSGSSAN